jgi:UDPglucose 6-dehydrogenase
VTIASAYERKASTLGEKIGIVGSGVVGLAVGRELASLNNVIFHDNNAQRVQTILDMGHYSTTNLESIVKHCDVIFVCVPTPTKNGKMDATIIKSAVRKIAQLARTRKEYFLLVVKSTVVPTTTEKTLIPIMEKYSGKNVGRDFGVCFNPEFVREKEALHDPKPDRIVIGQYDTRSGDTLYQLYKEFECPIIRTDIKTAEMIKYANNTFYAAKISFFNEIHLICQKLEIDSNIVRKVVQMDKYYPNHPWEHGHAFSGNVCQRI